MNCSCLCPSICNTSPSSFLFSIKDPLTGLPLTLSAFLGFILIPVPPAVALACRCASINVLNAGRVGSFSSYNFSFSLVSLIPVTSITHKASCNVMPAALASLAATFRLLRNALSSCPGCCNKAKNCFVWGH